MKKFTVRWTPAFLRLFTFAFLLLTFDFAFSQAPPNGINYQAVARDVSGNPLASQTVAVVFTIRSNNPTGPIVYSESQTAATNQFGLFTLTIGSTDPATFSAIAWSTDKFFLEVNVNGNPMGTTQFLSVPYAYHSKTADSIVSPTLRVWTKLADTLRTSFLNDYVGIGTASPKEKLHIVKPAGGMNPHVLLESTGGSFDIGYNIKTAGSNEWLIGKEMGEFDVLKLKWKSTSSGSSFTGFSMLSSGSVGIGIASPLQLFHIKDAEVAANTIDDDLDGSVDETDGVFVFTKEGRTGIGTAAPANKLHIIGTPNTDIVNISDGTASAAVYVNNGSGLAPVQFGSLSNHGIGFFTNNGVGAPAMVIKTNSNVGIGTTSPATRLDVVSSYTTAPYTLQSFNTANTSLTNNVGAVFGTVNGNNAAAISKYGGWFQAQSGTGTNYGVRGDVLGGTGTNYGVYGNVNTSPGATNIGGYFSAVNGTNNYAAIFDFGDVGIGTTTPVAKLHIRDGHIKSAQAVAPTVTQTGLTSVALAAGSTDTKGRINGTGSVLVAGSGTFTLTYNISYNAGTIPAVIVTPANLATAVLNYSVTSSAPASFTISFTNNGGANQSNPSFYYMVIE